ncbi:hypothetical protein N752_10675 [Desulforamulus aquiferis]|nr:hypothetical protein N752_10675 [Desulforamulus aquiferis]
MAVANSIMAVQAGVTQVQGTVNGWVNGAAMPTYAPLCQTWP